MIKPDELHEYMFKQLTDEQKAAYKDLMPVIVRGIIKAVQSKN
jgi:hypothetical protein